MTPQADAPPTTPGNPRRRLFDHPRGLAYLAFAEGWERFSFYGMQSLLVLYMVNLLLLPGHVEQVLGLTGFRTLLEQVFGPLSTQAFSSLIFGVYSGLAYLLPVFGGLIGDQLLGQHRCVMLGAILMALGHFLMAYEAPFLIALSLLIVGSGFLKGNITKQVGSLYAPDDRRRADAYLIFNLGVNIGVVAAPLVCGTLGEFLGWRYGFLAAGIGMLLGLTIYIVGLPQLPTDHRASAIAEAGVGVTAAPLRLRPGDARTIGALLMVLVVVTAYLIPGNELGNVYLLWLREYVARNAFGLLVPVTWFLSLTALVAIALPPLLLRLWSWQASRGTEPAMLTKIGIGCGLCACAFFGLAVLSAGATATHQVSWLWLLLFHLVFAVAYVYVWPVGLALFSQAAPPAIAAMTFGIYFISAFIASNIGGWIGSYYLKMTPVSFWLINASVPTAGVLFVLLFGRRLNALLKTAVARRYSG
jgi:POT family proton-dependent oligopeptide transporter